MPKDAFPILENDPSVGWGAKLTPKSPDSHKYDHGHVVVCGGRKMTGAGCLAAISALRMGAGLCTIVSAAESLDVYRNFSPSLIVEHGEEIARFKEHLRDVRRNAVVIGPGAGQDNPGGLRKAVLDAIQIEPRRTCILDADALTVFANDPRVLHHATGSHCVLTPHEGEFEKLFPDLVGPRADRAQAAALKTKAIIVLKGPETIIASPEGGCFINTNGSGALATAGTGDVLAGMIAGLAARNCEGLSLFGAVAAAVWMHAEAGSRFGPGLISADIPDLLPSLWQDVFELAKKKKKPRAVRA